MQTGSWFELANKNAIFGVLGPDNPLWSIILGFFGISGYPTAGELPAANNTYDLFSGHELVVDFCHICRIPLLQSNSISK